MRRAPRLLLETMAPRFLRCTRSLGTRSLSGGRNLIAARHLTGGRSLSTRASTLVGALDQGTSSTRFVLWDEKAQKVASHQMEHTQHYPHQGWCEHDPLEILAAVTTCIDEAVVKAEVKGYTRAQVAALGITNQRETTVVWDRFTGQPLYNAIVWLDMRTSAIAEQISSGDDLRLPPPPSHPHPNPPLPPALPPTSHIPEPPLPSPIRGRPQRRGALPRRVRPAGVFVL